MSKQRSRGPILPGDPEASVWTFTADRWAPGSYLWRTGDRVTLSFVMATRRKWGYFRELIAGIEGAGLRVSVPTPINDMPVILRRYGFVMHLEPFPEMGEDCEVWERPVDVPPVVGSVRR